MSQIPAWTGDSVPALTPQAFSDELERLEAAVIAVEAMALHPPTGSAALADAVGMTDRTRDLVVSLTTVCRARQSLNATDTLAGAWRSDVRRLSVRLENAAQILLIAVESLPETARSRDPFASWLSPMTHVRRTQSDVSTSVVLPLTSMHAHLVSTMKLRVPLRDGRMLNMSFPQAIAVLKTSDDPSLTRAVFGMFNAWFGEHAPAFADLLNAMLGWKLLKTQIEERELYDAALTAERLSTPAFLAMTRAIDERLEDIRRTVTVRAGLRGERRLHFTQILSSTPHAGSSVPTPFSSIDLVMDALSRAMVPADPAFAAFMSDARTSHWIDAKQQSGRAGGTWCEDLPAFGSVAIFANFVPSTAGAFQFAHPCGVGFLHRALHGEQALRKRLPFSVIEIFGMLAETMLERASLRAMKGTPSEPQMLWQMMRRASNHLLMIPSRHRLLAELYRARREGVLSVSDINALSRASWERNFGDTTDGFDQYVWAWKQHFYRPNDIFYDWQYTFGYLVSQMLAKSFDECGRTAAGADLRAFAVDAARMDCDTLLHKHLRRDIRSADFWDDAVSEALKVVPGF